MIFVFPFMILFVFELGLLIIGLGGEMGSLGKQGILAMG